MDKRAKANFDFLNDADKVRRSLARRGPEWLRDIRERASERFLQTGFPAAKDEEWKHTSITPIRDSRFSFPVENTLRETGPFEDYRAGDGISIVFVNGRFAPEHSNLRSLPDGITLCNLREGLQRDDALVKRLLTVYEEKNPDAFSVLNRVFLDDGAFIRIADNVITKQLIHVIHVTSTKEESTVAFPRSLIVAGRSSETPVLLSHVSFSSTGYFINAVSDVFLEENAKLIYGTVQCESPRAYHIGHVNVWQQRDSRLESFTLTTGGKLTRNNLSIVLNEEGAHATLNGLYALRENQHADNHTAVHHIPPHCTSSQLYKGILTDKAHGVFDGKIRVRKEAQLTNSYQLNKNLLLSRNAVVDTKPQLEIAADDVKCTHGATIGHLNEDEVFYLRTRGIPERDAVKMLSRGFVDDIVNRVEDPAMRKKMDYFIDQYFAKL